MVSPPPCFAAPSAFPPFTRLGISPPQNIPNQPAVVRPGPRLAIALGDKAFPGRVLSFFACMQRGVALGSQGGGRTSDNTPLPLFHFSSRTLFHPPSVLAPARTRGGERLAHSDPCGPMGSSPPLLYHTACRTAQVRLRHASTVGWPMYVHFLHKVNIIRKGK
ncbi:hypothetical protein GQ53DRAFT_93500 [Thozetella sp. PMI_491]|nr:hypothetical protein GQ53DRAFT_93500 [Thozetella sp. PMI_491]